MPDLRRVARASLPTRFGDFDAHAFQGPDAYVYLALVTGEIGDGLAVPVRIHSECLTGDALSSLRCDCGPQLQAAMRAIAAERRGVIVYATGHEGRGIGLVDKLRAYMEQDRGADTVDANLRLGLPVDARRYDAAASVLATLGVRSVRLLTNNPRKVEGLRSAGIVVEAREPLPTAPHHRAAEYLRTKQRRLGHLRPAGDGVEEVRAGPTDVSDLIGTVRPRESRPYVLLKYAQSLDGRIATATGDSKWISGEDERRASHALRASCDAVMVGIGTVLRDDPHLTVRLVAGSSPIRVVLDSSLRLPIGAHVLDSEAPTIVLTTDRSAAMSRRALRARGVAVHPVARGPAGVDLVEALALLATLGVRSLLVEGGAGVITSLIRARVVDRLVVGVAPTILGSGTEAVGNLGSTRVADGLRLTNRSVHPTGDDLVLAWDVAPDGEAIPAAPAPSAHAASE